MIPYTPILIKSGIIISNGNMFPKPFNANKLCKIPITNGIAKIKLTCFAIAFSFLVSLPRLYGGQRNVHDLHLLLLIV